MSLNKNPEKPSEVVYFNDTVRLQAQICNFYALDISQLSPEKIQILQAFISWLLSSIVFETKTQSWKYRNFKKGERGSFTFPMYQREKDGFSSFAHMLHGGDPKTPWPHFDFDAFESGCNAFIQKMGIEFDNTTFTQAQSNIKAAARKVHAAILSGIYEKVAEISIDAVKENLKHRSRSFELLASLGLDFGADSEGVCSIPMEYTLLD